MATVTKSIGTSKDYSTITLWEADLDDTGIYSSGDTALGECYNQTYDESVTLNGGGTVGLTSVTLSAESTNRHDGTEGTGARDVYTADRNWEVFGTGTNYTVEWLEIDFNGNNASSGWYPIELNSNTSGKTHTLNDLIIHGSNNSNGGNHNRVVGVLVGNFNILNSMLYDHSATVNNTAGMYDNSSQAIIVNNLTIFDIKNTGGGTGNGYRTNKDLANHNTQNVISMNAKSSDFIFNGSTNITSNNNLSSDLTSNDGGGSGHLQSKIASDQFVSTTAGSEDLHLKTGADAIDAGTDLGTTPSGVEIDIDGRDRDANADTWDMGADELVAAAAGGIRNPMGGPTVLRNPLGMQ